jgi:hypothetical protein
MNIFILIFKYFWLIALIATVINWLSFRKNIQKQIKKQPRLSKEYESLILGYLSFMSLPWLVMGVGCTIGGVTSVWHFFRPRDGNPYVLAWFGCIFFLWVSGTFWLFFKNGAETLAQIPGAVQFSNFGTIKDITDPKLIKLIWVLMLICGSIALAIMWNSNMQIPNIR